ncbi:MAG TPA: GH3 auxin-responsive promoter family protein [Patescibacteria group bacterium]|jgi:hypothetical protein|nr:GH3 auxin-responsive promoter family protein [Patescibacteria group bacterium]
MVTKIDPEATAKLLKAMLQPWHTAVVQPVEAQEAILDRLLIDYAQTDYGRWHSADKIDSLADYRQAFPITTYEEFKPLINRVMAGDVRLLLSEEPIGWSITRGTTKGESKFIPMTPTDMRQRVSAGRAMMNYVADSGQYELLAGVNLNLNFPSVVGTLTIDGREIDYGYSSGIYAKHVAQFTPIHSVPSQEEIDTLGGGKKMSDWTRRFELALKLCRNKDVTLIGGVYQTAVQFARYLRKEHKTYPKDIWRPKIMTLGSAPGINTRYRSTLKALYGPVVIREIYGATEGMFGQQRDHMRAWVPNYDLFFFEVETRQGIKMLHEMRPREQGSLIVSTPILPRYRIGDVIRAFRPPYFRCIGREQWWTSLRYYWDELTSFNLDQL